MATNDSDNSLFYQNSRYVSGGNTEGTSLTIEWWDKRDFQSDASDIEYVVEDAYAGKINALDDLAYAFYGDVSLWWIIAQYNNILDPVTEIVPGVVLMIPTSDRVKTDFVNGTQGGVPTTRIMNTNIAPVVV